MFNGLLCMNVRVYWITRHEPYHHHQQGMSIFNNISAMARYSSETVRKSPLVQWMFKSFKPNLTATPRVYHRSLDDAFLNRFDEIVIIGDIHGCYDEFLMLLDIIHKDVNPKRILKICVGDLVNKGPKNKEVVDYMMHNYDTCLSVRGNHDEVIIREYIKYAEKGELLDKNRWIVDLTMEQVTYLVELPYTIVIPQLNAVVVHAGLVPQVPLYEQTITDLTKMRNVIEKVEPCGAVTFEGTSQDTLGIPWASAWAGPQHIYFGHDAKRKLQEYKYATGLDTGAVYGDRLTAKFIMGPRANTFVAVKSLKMWQDFRAPK